MTPAARNNYTNRALRDVMRARRRLGEAEAQPTPIVRLVCMRMAEASLEAVRFRYGMPSTWDILK